MRIAFHTRFGSAVCAAALALPMQAAAGTPTYLAYYLPRAQIGAVVSQRLVACPAGYGTDGIIVHTSWALTARAVPDYASPVQVDATPRFLIDRTAALNLNPDGTLASLNATNEGGGGEVVGAVIRTAGALAPMLVGLPPIPFPIAPATAPGLTDSRAPAPPSPPPPPPPPPPERCTRDALRLLGEQDTLRQQIGGLEDTVAAGKASAAQIDLLARRRLELLAVQQQLTVTSSAPEAFGEALGGLQPCRQEATCRPAGSSRISAPGVREWFNFPELASAIPGAAHGFVVRWAASPAAAMAVARGLGPVADEADHRQLVYRRPVPAIMEAEPCAAAPVGDTCTADETPIGTAASGALEFAIPQLSPRFAMPIGGSVFGDRQANAVFDAWGRPTALSFGSRSGAAAFAGALEDAGAAVASFHTAGLDAMNHAIAMHEARAKLKEYTASVPAAAPTGQNND